MRQKMLKFSAGFIVTSAVAVAIHGLIGHSVARAETFDLRWTAVEPVQVSQKGDRLETPEQTNPSSVVFYSDPQARVTIATKVRATKNESSGKNPGKNPGENARREKKLPVGCDPSFSPVTVPSMAHVSGRCIAARDAETKVAELRR